MATATKRAFSMTATWTAAS